MTSVKGGHLAREISVPDLVGMLFRQVRDTFAAEDWDGLRPSHFRVIAAVPDGGISVSDLAERLEMTKQGCGQFVAQLTTSGHLSSTPDPHDRRVRMVHRTDLGERTDRAVSRRLRRIEEGWADAVGGDRYATFRAVLEEIALGA